MTDKQIEDNLNYIMPFGKYKGRHISEIPDKYIAWLLYDNIVEGRLRTQIEDCIKEKYKEAWLSKALKKWVYNCYEVRKRYNYNPRGDFTVGDYELYDAMDGCLPNQ
jgi:uncharacterized protein (DUF3820 family)